MKKITLFMTMLLVTAFNYTAKAIVSQTAVCTAGNLATVAASYLSTVTNLTVTGTIDARDFKTMRSTSMPALAVIDLSGATIEAYSGTAGCAGTTLIDYPANVVPNFAFCSPSSKGGKMSLKTFVYPSTVTAIGDYAFSGCINLAGNLTIPSTVTIIGERAYYFCYGLTGSLTIPSSVTTIGNLAFQYCRGFTGSLTISTLTTTIGQHAFEGCNGLTGSLTIPSSVTSIGNYAFGGCTSFTGSLTIPASVTSIGPWAFNSCSGLTGSLTIPSSITTIDTAAFYGCSGFTGSLTIPTSVTTIKQSSFYGCGGLTGTLTIPSSVTTIGSWAFSNCSGFTGSLTIPASVTTIDQSAFAACSGFTGSLTIPSSVTTIGQNAFSGCSGLIEADAANPNYSSIDGVLFNKDKTTLIQCTISKSGNYVIPSSVTTIGTSAFYLCKDLTGVTIPSSVTTIENYAFGGCIGLTGLLAIPASVTTIGQQVYGGLIIVDAANPNYSSLDGVLFNKDKTTLISYPYSQTGGYVIPLSVTTIGDYAFSGCSGLTGSLTIPPSVKIIGNYAFFDCSGLTGSLTIPASVTTIGDDAFYKCIGLTGSLTIPASVTTIGAVAFGQISGLTSVNALSTTPIVLNNNSMVFFMVSQTTCILHVPVGSKALYAAANEWRYFANIVDDLVPTSLNEVLSSSISIYPNPATSFITVSELGGLVTDKTATLSVTDVSGSTLLVKDVESTINSLTIDVSSFKSGIYFIAIQTSNGSVVKRFVKK